MIKYKLICLDLDGTLLDSKHNISQSTIEKLRFIESKGVKIAIVTGRAAFDAKKYAELISKDTYFLGSNGSVMGCAFSDTILFERAITNQTMTDLFEISNKLKINPVFYTADSVIVTSTKEYLLHLYYVKVLKMYNKSNLILIKNNKDLLRKILEMNKSIHKILFFELKSKKSKRVENLLRKQINIEMVFTSNICFEITEKNVNKSLGVQKLASALGISKEQIVAFGDSENDCEMLKYAGYGVAMGNATDHIKAISDRVTETNDNEGINIILEELLGKAQF